MFAKESVSFTDGYVPSASRPGPLSPLRTLRTLVRSWSESGSHLPSRLGTSRSLASSQPAPAELFTAALIGDLLLDLPDTEELTGRICAVLSDALLRTSLLPLFADQQQPADVGCTALACSLLLRAGLPVGDSAQQALDQMLSHLTPEGIIPTHIISGDGTDSAQQRGERVDLATCASALYLARLLGRSSEMCRTESYVRWFFLNGQYQQGTRHHPTAETFLYFFGRLVCHFPNSYVSLRQHLGQAVLARIGTSRHPIDLSQRIILARWLGLPNYTEQAQLQRLQQSDGTWPADSISLIPTEDDLLFLGSSALSTAFAYRALSPCPN